MATVNRYTQVRPAQYNPMSLEELMMVPMMKRKQHDTLLNNVAATQAALAQTDYMDMHEEKVMKLRKQLEGELERQVNEVSANGISDALKTDFMGLNAQYQNAVGPKGLLGQAQLAKQQLAAEKATYIQNATAAGYSPEQAAINWANHEDAYRRSQLDADEISNIDGLYAPKYYNVVDEFRALAKEAGLSSSDIANATSNIVYDDNLGSYVLTEEGREAIGNNEEQLAAIDRWINNNLNNPNSDLARSVAHQGKSTEDALREIRGLSTVYKKDNYAKSEGNRITNFNPIEAENDVVMNGMGIAASSRQYAPAEYSGKEYPDLQERVTTLEGKKNLTEDEEEELHALNQFKASIDKRLAKDEVYQEMQTELDPIQKTLDAINNGTYDYTKDSRYTALYDDSEVLNPQETSEKIKASIKQKTLNAYNKIKKRMDAHAKQYVKEESILSTTYQLVPYNTKQASLLKTLNTNADRLLRDNPSALYNLGNISQIILNNDILTGRNDTQGALTDNDKKQISHIFYNAKEGDIELVNFTNKGVGGKPEYTFRLKNSKGASYDLDGTSLANDDIGGEAQSIQLTVAVTDDNIDGIQNLNGVIKKYIGTTGTGRQIVDSMNINASKSKYGQYTWNQLLDSELVYTDPGVSAVVADRLARKGMFNPSDQQLEEEIRSWGDEKLYEYE